MGPRGEYTSAPCLLHGKIADSFELFHTGNESFVLDGAPPYKVGRSYVLFLMPRGDGSYLPISPEGVFLVNFAGGLVPMSAEPFAATLSGSRVEGLARDLTARRAAHARGGTVFYVAEDDGG